jgi:hypothetical protein
MNIEDLQPTTIHIKSTHTLRAMATGECMELNCC